MAATSAKEVETAKKTAEAVWVVEHATRCPDKDCGVAGCAKARAALTCLATRTVSASVSVSDIDAVRSVLQHRALCPWARPRGCTPSAASAEPCLVCVLASRARCVASDDGLVLDFSKRSPNDAGCFTAPRARAVTVAPVAGDSTSPVDAPMNKSPSFNAAAASLMSLSAAAPVAC